MQLELFNENQLDISMSDITFGKLITDKQERDAVHIAIAPVVAAEMLEPGQHIGFVDDGKVGTSKEPIGIVDPFLKEDVLPGETFWMFLYQKTVKNLRHDWSHPAFENLKSKDKGLAEAWLRNFASVWNMDFEEMVHEASHGMGITASGMDIHGWSELDDGGAEFWRQLEIYTGKKFDAAYREQVYISCSC